MEQLIGMVPMEQKKDWRKIDGSWKKGDAEWSVYMRPSHVKVRQ